MIRFATFSLRVEPYAGLFRAIVARGTGLAGDPVVVVVASTELEAATTALVEAAPDLAEELTG